MDHSLAVATNGAAFSWTNSLDMPSDEGFWDGLASPSPSSTESVWKGHSSTPPPPPPPLQTGQLSPGSSSAGSKTECCSRPNIVHSTSSSSTDGSSSGYGERDEAEDDAHWDGWEQTCDEVLAIPKLEPVDDDLNLDEFHAVPFTPMIRDGIAGAGEVKPKRPRGRPRKHPLGSVVNASKVTKGRSKTGCITCRKRKKKCDEAKPRCMNCEKNAVVCEGYHEKQVWKSGKERAEERMKWENLPVITMQPIFHGVETTEDKIFWKHYINHLSNVLTVEGEARNAFKDIILQLANRHQGLMHSILAVSSTHIDLGAPYGAKILREYPMTSKEALRQRGEYHHDKALKRLYEDMAKPMDKDDPEYKTILAARYGQMLCLLLQTRAEGNPRGEHRVHLQAYKNLVQHNPPDDPTLHTFITEFFQYHIYADDLFWHPETMSKRLSSEDWEASEPIHPPRLLGVADGLFRYLSQITSIRNGIRANMAASVDPVVDHTSLYKAAEIDGGIREWTPDWPLGDSRGRLGLLHKQMMWVHLFRTIYPPRPACAPARRSTLPSLPPAPSKETYTSRDKGGGRAASHSPFEGLQNPWTPPPAPACRPAHDDRITLAVDESLDILDSFTPSDPAQTLLLIPCLVLGTACFGASQQQRVRTAVKAVRGYTGLKSCDRVLELLEEVWRLMELEDWVAVWDWQGVARRMGLNFPCT